MTAGCTGNKCDAEKCDACYPYSGVINTAKFKW